MDDFETREEQRALNLRRVTKAKGNNKQQKRFTRGTLTGVILVLSFFVRFGEKVKGRA